MNEFSNKLCPKVFIVILNWNKPCDTIECLKSVYSMDYGDFEVLVIDNASDDDSVDQIRQAFPGVRLVVNKENNGFTGGNNQGMKVALSEGADYVWLLNNDTIVEKSTLSSLIGVASESYDFGLVSPRIFYYDDPSLEQYSLSYVDWNKLEIYSSNDLCSSSKKNKTYEVCLWATALLIKRSVIEKIGYLCEDYFAYYEDTEYSLRSIKNGFKNILDYNSKIYHKNPVPGESYVTRSDYYYYYMIRNEYLMWKMIDCRFKNTAFRHLSEKAIKKADSFKSKGMLSYSRLCLQAYFDAIIGRKGKINSKDLMPMWLVRLILFCPYFLLNMIVLDFIGIKRQIYNKLFFIGNRTKS